jgi:hypothetical protein
VTAAFTGLRRGELFALRWRGVDFETSAIRVRASYSGGALTMPKSGRVRSVPMAPDVGRVLARLGQRERFVNDDALVFVGEMGSYLDGSALRRRYDRAVKRAGLRPLRFHDLRHTFATQLIARTDIRRVQEWMGHADTQTTMKYLHCVPRHDVPLSWRTHFVRRRRRPRRPSWSTAAEASERRTLANRSARTLVCTDAILGAHRAAADHRFDCHPRPLTYAASLQSPGGRRLGSLELVRRPAGGRLGRSRLVGFIDGAGDARGAALDR